MSISKRERVETLKSLKKLATLYLNYYKRLCKSGNRSWINKKGEQSIRELTRLIRRINADLHPLKVDAYCRPMPEIRSQTVSQILNHAGGEQNRELNEYFSGIFTQTNATSALFSIASHAPESNVIHDITWIKDGTIEEYIAIGLGKQNVTVLEKYLPSRLRDVRERVLPFYSSMDGYNDHVHLIKQALCNTDTEGFLISNILLITVVESLVRKLLLFLFLEQNAGALLSAGLEYVYETFNSLDTLISKGEWKDDYPIGLAEAMVHFNDVNEASLNTWRNRYDKHIEANEQLKRVVEDFGRSIKLMDPENDVESRKISLQYLEKLMQVSNDLLSAEDFRITVSATVLLNFLVRKYKDDRNLIVHGNFEELNHKWKNYVSYCALIRVYEIENQYRIIYGTGSFKK